MLVRSSTVDVRQKQVKEGKSVAICSRFMPAEARRPERLVRLARRQNETCAGQTSPEATRVKTAGRNWSVCDLPSVPCQPKLGDPRGSLGLPEGKTRLVQDRLARRPPESKLPDQIGSREQKVESRSVLAHQLPGYTVGNRGLLGDGWEEGHLVTMEGNRQDDMFKDKTKAKTCGREEMRRRKEEKRNEAGRSRLNIPQRR
ncbi:hypothetical protein ASPZODRAFT_587079 [Penicilliopsis zonata CBS 506.65]|uniref:Uncharacterized protein n=1 Tax=Penicilliopsis zonata CBS 506.65 TaxID=1073090 RepID=A0A1L9SE74_9EURO|nr:hypothetical protein ASPZODRAFT_587079 [Penicilliopsis zonata CBS 506.65]OJJ45397.1 hypothetical protein ASPZODRAFT_587079 [Penicilliopsis zonata CBS 506.65]